MQKKEIDRNQKEIVQRVYYLQPVLPPGPSIQLIGIPHGTHRSAIPRAVSRFLNKALLDYPGRIYTEGAMKGPSYALPRVYRSSAKGIESRSVMNHSWRLLTHDRKKGWQSVWGTITSPLFDRATGAVDYFKLGKQIATNPLSDRQLELNRNWFKYHLKKETSLPDKAIAHRAEFITSIRSVMMAGRLLQHRRRHQQPIVFVSGSIHASEIHQFLKNPAKTLEYVKGAHPRFGEDNMSARMGLLVAEREFTRLRREKERRGAS